MGKIYDTNSEKMRRVRDSDIVLVSYVWSGTGTGAAPAIPADAGDGSLYGCDSSGASSGTMYWNIGGVWTSLDVTVAQFHGGV
jgi:hypothetical protein